MKTYFTTKRNAYQITVNENGKVVFYPECPDAASIIGQHGGVESFLSHCIEDSREYDEFAEAFRNRQLEAQIERKAQGEARAKAEREKITNEYNNLVGDGSDPIEATAANLYIIMRYLNTINLGLWRLPRLSQGYRANQYSCNGKNATTITLDEGIKNDEGRIFKKFQYGAPSGHLTSYTNIGRNF